MTTQQQERINNWKLHPSQRGHFALAMYKAMAENENIYLLTGDLGFSVLDPMRDDFPDRFCNVGAAEQCMLGTAIGMALYGKKVFCYSITSFLIYRPFEWIRNFLQHEGIPVRLIGSGLDADYAHDGITHQTFDVKEVMKQFWRIDTYYPDNKEMIPDILRKMIESDKPSFLCLRR